MSDEKKPRYTRPEETLDYLKRRTPEEWKRAYADAAYQLILFAEGFFDEEPEK